MAYTKSTKELLIEAKALIADKKNWTKKAFARREDGEAIAIQASTACAFCSVGAVVKAAGERNADACFIRSFNSSPYKAFRLLDNEAAKFGDCTFTSLVGLNDYGSHEDVMQVFDNAIKACEGGQYA